MDLNWSANITSLIQTLLFYKIYFKIHYLTKEQQALLHFRESEASNFITVQFPIEQIQPEFPFEFIKTPLVSRCYRFVDITQKLHSYVHLCIFDKKKSMYSIAKHPFIQCLFLHFLTYISKLRKQWRKISGILNMTRIYLLYFLASSWTTAKNKEERRPVLSHHT